MGIKIETTENLETMCMNQNYKVMMLDFPLLEV